MTPQRLWAPRAWLGGAAHDGWAANVLMESDTQGRWQHITPDTPPPADATRLNGPVLPGLVDAHSHAFQRAFAGLAERLDPTRGGSDDFWSWRERMYAVAQRITPTQLQAVAAQLQAELLCGGYTQVCEFHYLQHAASPADQPADTMAFTHALVAAAAHTGIGLTMLPVLYERAGFTQPQLRAEQRRFATTVASVLALRDGVRALGVPQVNAGVAVHSLRAAMPESLHALARAVADDAAPIHIHIAEQTAEVDDCLAATGRRPIEWLTHEASGNLRIDARWHLVHATHTTPAEVEAVARSGAGVVLCPSTEANLGDGLADVPRWQASGTPLSLGSDSQVCRCWPEELRWLEYGQRLTLRRRNVSATPAQTSSARHLFERVLAGGAHAAGHGTWGLKPGARADFLVINSAAPGLLGVPESHTLDALVFANDGPVFSDVWVAGQCVVQGGQHRYQAPIAQAFVQAMHQLWP
jgi:formimidoylglutamate deiminase